VGERALVTAGLGYGGEALVEVNGPARVMGSRGLSDFQALLVGSVAHKVLHYAHCPVLIVR
jgi:nucleotide-binding universal stress UspA family protein